LEIHPQIGRAETPPGWLYRDPRVAAVLRERALASSWQLALEVHALDDSGPPSTRRPSAVPFTLLPGSLDEPLVITRGEDGVERCLSNVCTHRANLLLDPERDAPCVAATLRCGYHGRRFGLDGRMQHMPGFEGVEGFPSARDDLAQWPIERLGPLPFVSLAPHSRGIGAADSLRAQLGGLAERLRHMPWDAMRFDPQSVRVYAFDAHWLLYVENFLEGFHIPFVHPALTRALDFGSYETALYPKASVQVADAADGDPCFEAPSGHPDHGRRVAAYYAWLWPNTMLNFYPWGCSANIVRPRGEARTEVVFARYVAHPELLESGAGTGLDQVELEDEDVVCRVQRGVGARGYRRGRYSPEHERGVHHFHRLVAHALDQAGP